MANILIVDENDNPIGSSTAEEARAKGLYHRICRVVLKNEKGQFLLQLRSPNKSFYPNRWTDSASGHVDVGETYEEAVVGKFLSTHTNDGIVTPVFNGVFEGRISSDQTIILKSDEVSDTRWIDFEALKEEIETSADNFTPGFIDSFNEYYLKQ